MAIHDAERWNRRYAEKPKEWYVKARPILVDHQHLLPATGYALDVAMGPGLNASFLADRGLQVVGVDISSVAVQMAKKRDPRIRAVVADLDTFFLPSNSFDVILNLYFLQRSLWPLYQQALKPGGLLFIETLTLDMRQKSPEIAPEMLLAPGELKLAFQPWEIVFYREGWYTSDHGKQKAIASIIVRKPLFKA